MSAEAYLATSEGRAQVRNRATLAVARSRSLAFRIAAIREEHDLLVEHSLQVRHAIRLQRARSAGDRGAPAVGGFLVEGVVDGDEVSASWAEGRLVCDDALRTRALLLVDLEEEFLYSDPPRCFIASLSSPPIAVALTLIRACDRVTRIVLAPPEAA
jgi:hypothetical protein